MLQKFINKTEDREIDIMIETSRRVAERKKQGMGYFNSNEYKKAFDDCEKEMMEKTKREIENKGDAQMLKIIDGIINNEPLDIHEMNTNILNGVKAKEQTNKYYNDNIDNKMSVGNFLKTNRFLLNFDGDFDIKQWWVQSVKRDYDNRMLSVEIREVVNAETATIKEILKIQNSKIKNITLEMLDANDDVAITYKYNGCQVTNINLPELNYKPKYIQKPKQQMKVKGLITPTIDNDREVITHRVFDEYGKEEGYKVIFPDKQFIDFKIDNHSLVEDDNLSIITVNSNMMI